MEKKEWTFNKREDLEIEKKDIESVEPIEEKSDAEIITERKKLNEYIEEPLLEACQELYDKNIRTLSSSANRKDVQSGEGYIIIDFDSLSEKNKEIAQEKSSPYTHGEFTAIKISFPLNEFSTVNEISEKANTAVADFSEQEPSWIPVYTLEDLKKSYGISPDEEDYNHPQVWVDEGYYYDHEKNLFYLSQDHYNKIKSAEKDNN